MNKRDLDDKLLDDVISYIASEHMENIVNDLPSDEELDQLVHMRPQFEKKMSKFFKQLKSKDKRLRIRQHVLRTAIIFVLFIFVSTAVICSVEAFRVPVLNFFNIAKEKSTTIEVGEKGVDYNVVAERIHGLALPSYIPENYSISTFEGIEQYYIANFINSGDNKIIKLETLLEGSVSGVDNEGVQINNLTVNDESA